MTQQTNLYRNKKYPTYEEIIQEYSDEINNYIEPEGDNIFGFWMQTIADLQLLDLELQGLICTTNLLD